MSESRKIGNCVVRLTRQDITDFEVEAFVYYARPNLVLGAGFGNAIATRGGASIKAELDKLAPLPVTEAVVTSAGKLKAKYIVHAVGPAFQEEDLEAKLRTTIETALRRAEEKGIRQIAFPAMGAGFYGVPLPTCAEIMLQTFRQYHSNGTSGLEEVIICANDGHELRAFQAKMAILN